MYVQCTLYTLRARARLNNVCEKSMGGAEKIAGETISKKKKNLPIFRPNRCFYRRFDVILIRKIQNRFFAQNDVFKGGLP